MQHATYTTNHKNFARYQGYRMKYCGTDSTGFLFGNFCLKTVKHRVTDGASMKLPPGLSTCYLEYENKVLVKATSHLSSASEGPNMAYRVLCCSYSCPLVKSEENDCFQQAFIDATFHNSALFSFNSTMT